jgi:hypothetical protein
MDTADDDHDSHSGEIDIMEQRNKESLFMGTLHFRDGQNCRHTGGEPQVGYRDRADGDSIKDGEDV